MAFTEIRSPYDGLVTRRDRDPGGIVVPGASILQLVATNEIWVSAWVDETAMSGLKAGQPARVVFRSEPAKSYAGEVARLGREADRETREFVVDVRVKELPENWTIGQRAEVFIETGRKSGVVVIPQPFVLWREGKPGVFVNDHGKAQLARHHSRHPRTANLEVTQGLSAGEQIVKPPAGQSNRWRRANGSARHEPRRSRCSPQFGPVCLHDRGHRSAAHDRHGHGRDLSRTDF